MPEEYRLTYAWARALEWEMFPAFVSQPAIPLFYFLFGWKETLIWLVIANFLWNLIFCTAVISLSLAAYGMVWTKLKWPSIAAFGVYFGIEHRWTLLALTLATPLVCPVLGNIAVRRPTKVIQEFMLLPLGMVSKTPSPPVEKYLRRLDSKPLS